MVIGSGLIATAMRPFFSEEEGYCIFAAGVSNSGCRDQGEFDRETARLKSAMADLPSSVRLVYFGTCSVADPAVREMPYVHHKLAMEALAKKHGKTTVFRLPQVIGKTPNPHTLINYLYARIARSERFSIWESAKRYIIHVDDMAVIAHHLLVPETSNSEVLNIANPRPYSILEIVYSIERLVGKPAVYDVADRGGGYRIDTACCEAAATHLGIAFGEQYLDWSLRRTFSFSELGVSAP